MSVAWPGDGHVGKIKKIQHVVARYYGITAEEMLTRSRAHRVLKPRQVAFYLSRKFTRYSLKQIARRSGGYDHTTVMYGIEQVSAAVNGAGRFNYHHAVDASVANDVRRLAKTIEKGIGNNVAR